MGGEKEEAGFVRLVKGTDALPLKLPLPALTSRSALAPKLIRLANGVVGVLLGLSPSSIALSSTLVPGEPDPLVE